MWWLDNDDIIGLDNSYDFVGYSGRGSQRILGVNDCNIVCLFNGGDFIYCGRLNRNTICLLLSSDIIFFALKDYRAGTLTGAGGNGRRG